MEEIFLLPHPSRGATIAFAIRHIACSISTPTPLAGCDTLTRIYNETKNISTPTPLAGCDPTRHGTAQTVGNFYSHTPRGVRRSAASRC